MDLATEATPANVLFWSRAQYKVDPGRSTTSTGPQTPEQRAQRMADFYADVGSPLVNEHDRIEPVQDFIPGPFFEDRRHLPLRFPEIIPCPEDLLINLGPRWLRETQARQGNSPKPHSPCGEES